MARMIWPRRFWSSASASMAAKWAESFAISGVINAPLASCDSVDDVAVLGTLLADCIRRLAEGLAPVFVMLLTDPPPAESTFFPRALSEQPLHLRRRKTLVENAARGRER